MINKINSWKMTGLLLALIGYVGLMLQAFIPVNMLANASIFGVGFMFYLVGDIYWDDLKEKKE